LSNNFVRDTNGVRSPLVAIPELKILNSGPIKSNISSEFSTSSVPLRIRPYVSTPLSSLASVVINETKLTGLSNPLATRTYTANQKTAIFASNPPVIQAPSGTSVKVEIFYPANGTIGSLTAPGTGTFYTTTTDISTINNIWSNLYFWPNKDYKGADNIQIKLYFNNVLYIDRQLTALAWDGLVSIDKTVTLSVGSGAYQFTAEDYQYYKIRCILVAGGGGGGTGQGGTPDAGGAGGGGGYVTTIDWREVPRDT
jgi:hypothetical protein